MSPEAEDYRDRIARVLSDLGLPADYGAMRSMPLQAEAIETVIADVDPDGTEVRLTPPAALAWKRLKCAAVSAGVELVAYSGFRSVNRQLELIRRKQAEGVLIETIFLYIAAPGYSEHHTGRAIDIGTIGQPPLEEAFETTAAFRWLVSHAGQYGFDLSYPRDNAHGIGYEPWHWCFNPPA